MITIYDKLDIKLNESLSGSDGYNYLRGTILNILFKYDKPKEIKKELEQLYSSSVLCEKVPKEFFTLFETLLEPDKPVYVEGKEISEKYIPHIVVSELENIIEYYNYQTKDSDLPNYLYNLEDIITIEEYIEQQQWTKKDIIDKLHDNFDYNTVFN